MTLKSAPEGACRFGFWRASAGCNGPLQAPLFLGGLGSLGRLRGFCLLHFDLLGVDGRRSRLGHFDGLRRLGLGRRRRGSRGRSRVSGSGLGIGGVGDTESGGDEECDQLLGQLCSP